MVNTVFALQCVPIFTVNTRFAMCPNIYGKYSESQCVPIIIVNIVFALLFFQVQRIPEYDKYLNELLQETDQSHPDFDDLKRAADKVRNVSTLSSGRSLITRHSKQMKKN